MEDNMQEANNEALRAWADNEPSAIDKVIAGFLVVLELPGSMTPEEALANLRTCVSFGNARISMSFAIDDRTSKDGSYSSIGTPRNGPASGG
jgi:hypothetical protein